MTEFNAWIDDIIDTYDMPTSDRDSILFVVSNMILQLNAAYKPKYYFAKGVKSAGARQIAGEVFYEVKMRQRAAEEEARKKAAEEASKSQSETA